MLKLVLRRICINALITIILDKVCLMSIGIYSKGENRFLPKMEGDDPPNVGLPLPESWGLPMSQLWV